jgi:ABC-2 type transport system ATP-binding protein
MTLDHGQQSPAAHVATAHVHGPRRPAPWIVADGLTKRFGDHTAVDGLTFQVPRGVVTGFLGPNGSGKTTTMRMIVGLVRPSAGTATVSGRPFAELAAPGRQVGVVIDGAAAHPRRTGRDHLRILAAERGVNAGRIPQVLSAVELTDASERKVGEYSLGMRQRLHLAAALLGEPAALILDEPGNGLDPAGIRWLRDFLKAYAGAGGTVFVSSHQLDEMSRLADDVVVINRGRLVTQTSVGQLTAGRTVKVTSPQADAIARAVSQAGGVIRSVDGMTLHLSDIAPEDVGAICLRIGAVLYELAPQKAALEDVFLELTSDEGEPS